MRTKAILIAIAGHLVAASADVWFLIWEKQAARQRQQEYVGTSKEFLTSGGKKTKPQW